MTFISKDNYNIPLGHAAFHPYCDIGLSNLLERIRREPIDDGDTAAPGTAEEVRESEVRDMNCFL